MNVSVVSSERSVRKRPCAEESLGGGLPCCTAGCALISAQRFAKLTSVTRAHERDLLPAAPQTFRSLRRGVTHRRGHSFRWLACARHHCAVSRAVCASHYPGRAATATKPRGRMQLCGSSPCDLPGGLVFFEFVQGQGVPCQTGDSVDCMASSDR